MTVKEGKLQQKHDSAEVGQINHTSASLLMNCESIFPFYILFLGYENKELPLHQISTFSFQMDEKGHVETNNVGPW